MEMRESKSFWKRVNAGVHKFFEELKEESVASNPRKPVDCCSPPTPPTIKKKAHN